jgi:uncharacterized protein YdhG (YjbR/CyaY superfamily)
MNATAQYIASFAPDIQDRLHQVRTLVLDLVPEPVEVMAYGIPTVDFAGKHVIHYAGYAQHIGVYPGPEALAALTPLLAGYKSAKGSVQFPHTLPLPVAVIAALVEHRLGAVRAQVARKKQPAKPATETADSGHQA